MSASGSRYKIWYQGATDRSVHGDYISRLEAHLKSVADPEFTGQFTGVNPPASTTHALTEYRIGAAIARNVVRAEREGYDAVAITHFQDAGLHEAKSAVDIPVLGLGETTLLYSCSLGRKLGLITINPAFIPWHEDQIIRYGLTQRVVGVRAVDAKVSDFMRAFATKEGYAELYPKFEREAKVLLDAGADVIVPAGGLPMLLFGSAEGRLDRRRADHQRPDRARQDDRDDGQAEADQRHRRQPALELRQAAEAGARRVHGRVLR